MRKLSDDLPTMVIRAIEVVIIGVLAYDLVSPYKPIQDQTPTAHHTYKPIKNLITLTKSIFS